MNKKYVCNWNLLRQLARGEGIKKYFVKDQEARIRPQDTILKIPFVTEWWSIASIKGFLLKIRLI